MPASGIIFVLLAWGEKPVLTNFIPFSDTLELYSSIFALTSSSVRDCWFSSSSSLVVFWNEGRHTFETWYCCISLHLFLFFRFCFSSHRRILCFLNNYNRFAFFFGCVGTGINANLIFRHVSESPLQTNGSTNWTLYCSLSLWRYWNYCEERRQMKLHHGGSDYGLMLKHGDTKVVIKPHS